MTLQQRIGKIADELCLDLRDSYTRMLATAMAAVEAEDEAKDYMRYPHAICGCCLAKLQRGETVLDGEMGLVHWPDCP